MNAMELAGMIDHTFLKANGTSLDVENLCREAVDNGFATVVVNPSEIETCLPLVRGSRVKVCATVGFPLGQNTTEVKVFESADAIQRGASELDMVINVRAAMAGKVDFIRREMDAFAAICGKGGAVSKVILETCYLDDVRKKELCLVAAEAGIGFVKTSTGLGTGGATPEDVRLMRDIVGTRCGVKAAGGIRTLVAALAMIDAGANRIGTSAGVAIMKEWRDGARP